MSRDKQDQPSNPDNKKDEDAVAFLQGLFELARNGGTGPLNVMLDAGVPVDIRTSDGDTLFMLACKNGHTDTARMLLDRGADSSLTDRDGHPASELAERTKADAAAKLIR